MTLPCSSVDPNGGPTSPADGWPRHFGGDGYASAEANTYRCALDPSQFACPTADADSDYASSGGPLITMPNCYGMTIGGCESAIDNALSAAVSTTTAAFSTVAAPTYNPALPVGVVVATIAAAGTLSDASAVTMELNESTPSGNCQSKTQWPHPSTTQQSYGMMLVKGQVICTTDQTGLSVNVILWKCTSEPDPSTDNLQSSLDLGTWGCVELKNAPYSVSVAANIWSTELVAAASEGPQAGAYYIGSTTGIGVDQSFSQVVPASLWLPAGEWLR